MSHKQHRLGFTIVETMLSMVFISLLILGVAVVTNRMIGAYRKGVALKSINQVGQLLSDDFNRSTATSRGVNLAKSTDFVNRTDYGALCTGKYSYVWTLGKTLVDDQVAVKALYFAPPHNQQLIYLVKIADNSKMYCELARGNRDQLNQKINKTDATELIKPGDSNIAIHEIELLEGATNFQGQQKILTLVFSLGTFLDKTAINQQAQCLISNDSSWGNNCAISKFEIVLRSSAN